MLFLFLLRELRCTDAVSVHRAALRLVLVSRTSSQSSETLPAQRVRLLSTSWADILDDDDEDLLRHLAREAMHLRYEQLMSLLAVTWEDPAPDLMLEAAAPAAPAAAAAPAGMEPAPESETALADCASLIKAFVQRAGRGVK